MVKILVIDDDKNIRQSIRKILEPESHEILEASSGEEGLTIYDQNPTPLVILDLNATDKDALMLMATFLKKNPNIKIIVLYDSENKTKSLTFMYLSKNMGAWRVLQKPIDAKQLIRAINAAIGLTVVK